MPERCVICNRAREFVIDWDPFCSTHAYEYMAALVWPDYLEEEDEEELSRA